MTFSGHCLLDLFFINTNYVLSNLSEHSPVLGSITREVNIDGTLPFFSSE